MSYLLVACGGAFGSVLRYWCGIVITARWGSSFPWATMFVNVTGSFLIGVIAALTQVDGRWGNTSTLRDLLIVGVLGGYTTFSAFSLQTLLLLREGKASFALMNICVSVVLCMLAVWLGFALAVNSRSVG